MKTLDNAACAESCDSSAADWTDLILRTSAGDADALAILYDSASPYVNGLALRILGRADAAEEVVVDVFTQVWRQAARYDSSRGRPLTWILRITRSRAIDHLRKRARQEREIEPVADGLERVDPGAGPEEDLVLSRAQASIRAEVARLSKPERQVLELAYFRGLSQSEIAEALDVPLGTVKTRTRLAVARIRKALRGIEEILP